MNHGWVSKQGVWRAQALDRIEWLEHGFGTRACPLTDLPAVAVLQQIHSDVCLPVAGQSGCVGEGDALLASRPGDRIGVKTADCLPVLLVDEDRRAVAAVHAGWRGTAARIAQKAVLEMSGQFGVNPSRIQAAIGPGVGVCCYEVGPEVARQFRTLFPERADLELRTHIDLVEANRRQLVAAGVLPESIHAAGLCTVCRGEEFCSFRREGERAGRMLSFIGIRAQTKTGRERCTRARQRSTAKGGRVYAASASN